jgi:hypothetical protein
MPMFEEFLKHIDPEDKLPCLKLLTRTCTTTVTIM